MTRPDIYDPAWWDTLEQLCAQRRAEPPAPSLPQPGTLWHGIHTHRRGRIICSNDAYIKLAWNDHDSSIYTPEQFARLYKPV